MRFYLVIYNLTQLFNNILSEESKCDELKQPENGYFVGGICSNALGNACVIKCQIGYKQHGSSYRKCFRENSTWSGYPTRCENSNEYGTSCRAQCKTGYTNLGSAVRYCLPLGIWSGLEAKCKKIGNFNVKPTSGLSTTTTQPVYETYEDLSNKTISFDYSFKKIDLIINIFKLPITFISWIKTKYTTNIKIFQYNYACNELLILTDSNSSIYLNINKIYNYKLRRTLIRNEWTQIAFIQTDSVWQLFIDGSLQVDIFELRLVFQCETNTDESENEFQIIDSKLSDRYHSMRGDLTHTYLYNVQMSEEQIIRNVFICEKISSSNLKFDWSNVLVNNFLRKFKKKSNGFCTGCPQPEFLKHAVLNYQGSKTGNIRWYKCLNGFKMIGYASSICMVHGSWSNKMPKCKVIN